MPGLSPQPERRAPVVVGGSVVRSVQAAVYWSHFHLGVAEHQSVEATFEYSTARDDSCCHKTRNRATERLTAGVSMLIRTHLTVDGIDRHVLAL